MKSYASYQEFHRAATGHDPYPWQERVALEGLPEVVAVETGAGKTAAVVLAWLWRRRYHPDPEVRSTTPHWLVMCLPMRVLTEQVEEVTRAWLAALGLDGVGSTAVAVHVAMGGREDSRAGAWRRAPHLDSIVIGTVDMLLSRALNRGYASGRFAWPIDFGLLHNGCQWVFDEIQLLGPALTTSRQLDGLRQALQTAVPSASTWMSATVDRRGLETIDRSLGSEIVSLEPIDRAGALSQRLQATRRVRQLPDNRPGALAVALLATHRAGTLTLAILNTVGAARSLYEEILRLRPEAEVVLLHSRFRALERQHAVGRALEDPVGAGRIVVSTQVLEAGVDISAATMLTEAAPWPSIVQRAGRCNRDGAYLAAELLWVRPSRPAPYPAADVDASAEVLSRLEGHELTVSALRDIDVDALPVVHPVLRRRDLLGLFDTAPDLSGNDVDVAPFIRATDEPLDVFVAWRDLGGQPPAPEEPRPARDELCPAPRREVEDLARRTDVWYFDHIAGAWSRIRSSEVASHPGLVVIVDSHVGCYRPDTGWDPRRRDPVPVIVQDDIASLTGTEEAIDADSLSYLPGKWVRLSRHLGDVECQVSILLEGFGPAGLSPGARQAAQEAGRLHDVGKAHDVFQGTMLRCADEDSAAGVAAGAPWAKSGSGKARHSRRHFRHELASALALLGSGDALLARIPERDLVLYLVAAHHGRIRMSVRSTPDEATTVLGVADGDRMPEVALPGGDVLPAAILSLDVVRTGRGPSGEASWTERSEKLLEQLGPFRLAFLESVVRLADWRASAAEAEEESDL